MKLPQMDGTARTDVSAQMDAFFKSIANGTVVEFPCRGRFRVDAGLILANRRNLRLVGNESSIIVTTPGDRTRSNVRLRECVDMTIERLNTIGANPYAGLGDEAYVVEKEAQHGFDLFDSVGTVLSDCSSQDVYGDFVCMNGMKGGASNTLIERFTGVRNGRQGMSIADGHDITIDAPALSGVRRTMFDVEPNGASNEILDVLIRGGVCGTHRGNFLSGFGHQDAPAGRITVADMLDLGGALTASIIGRALPETPTRFDWKILRCRSDTPVSTPHQGVIRARNVAGLQVIGNVQPMKLPANVMRMVLAEQCTLVDVRGNAGVNMAGQVLVA